jgi:hypothetical protein
LNEVCYKTVLKPPSLVLRDVIFSLFNCCLANI